MRAVWLTRYGGPEVLVPGDAPDPVPGPGQVTVEVAYINVTFVETQFRATGFGPFRGEPPMIPGNGVGGRVVAVGPDVDPGLVGWPVVTGTGGSGGYAERVAVPVGGLFPVPDGLPLDAAVAVLSGGRTAMMLMAEAGLRSGESALVEAAAGGVGSFLVQLAEDAGARVVAAVGGPDKVRVARSLGADVVVDYLEPGWAERVRTEVGGLDVAFDGVGGDIGQAAFELLEPGGRLLSYGLASGGWTAVPAGLAAERRVRLVRPSAPPERLRAYTEQALAAAAAGRLRPLIGQRFPLDRAAEAHAALGSRQTVGRTLLVTSTALE